MGLTVDAVHGEPDRVHRCENLCDRPVDRELCLSSNLSALADVQRVLAPPQAMDRLPLPAANRDARGNRGDCRSDGGLERISVTLNHLSTRHGRTWRLNALMSRPPRLSGFASMIVVVGTSLAMTRFYVLLQDDRNRPRSSRLRRGGVSVPFNAALQQLPAGPRGLDRPEQSPKGHDLPLSPLLGQSHVRLAATA